MLEKSRKEFTLMKSMQVGVKAVEGAKKLGALKEEIVTATPTVETIKHVGKKTFYLRAQVWIDSEYKERIETTKVKYGTEEYFKLLVDKPGLNKFFAIGNSLIVKFDGKWYEVINIETETR
jgi:NACalpha-BTF3-like transcription factor